MKKVIFFVCFVMIFSLSACEDLFSTDHGSGFRLSQGGQGDTQGGFRGPSNVTTVAQALTLRDDTPVVMRGNIIRYLGNERYLFSDSTGTITVEIERKVWGSLSVDENDLVEISGEIDRDWNSIEVEVDRIRKL